MIKTIKYLKIYVLLSVFCFNANAQVGNLIWEDNFNTLNTDIWNIDVGNGCEIGLCGWGNAELQYYRNENLSIEAIPGESGNNALVMEARREGYEGFDFTSGKVTSEGKLSVHYGMIEIRMQTPPVETGLWPAAWLLGTANVSWPAKGELDMMEMGHASFQREAQGHGDVPPDNYVGANAIFANEDGSVGSIAYDANYNKPYVAGTSMANRFMTYRLYWEPTELRFTVVDNGVEHDLYEGPLPLSNDSVTSAFQKPFFLLMNLAVGGNFTDAAVPSQVTANLPSKLYIDYVRVYEWNGYGTVEFDYDELVAESGPFGVYTETTPTNNQLSFGLDSEIYVWGGTMQDGTTEAFEGSEVIAWETLNPNGWFGGGIASTFGRDMSGYLDEGVLRFNLKVPADLSFRIGVTDNYTNESWISFEANESKYGLVRNGEWSQVEIPIIDFAGLIAFQNMNYMFAISSVDGAFPSSSVQIGIDNIVWDDGNPLSNDIPVSGVSISPDNSSLLVGETVQLSETVSPTDATNQNVSWSTSNSAVATVSSNGLVTAVSEGTTEITVTTEDGDFTATSNITVTNPDSLPSPWQSIDIGTVGAAGEASFADETFTVSGSGSDIWNAADEFHFVYQTLEGDGEIIAQVNSIENTNPWAKAGVMIRESLNSDSAHAMSVVTPSNGVSFQRRTATGNNSNHNTTGGQSAPKWLRIKREGNVFTSHYSNDGSSWTQIGGNVAISMASTVYVGLCVTSHNDGTLTNASINNVSVNTLTPTNTGFPDPTKKYYIDASIHNLRIAASGESEDPYTVPTGTTGADVEWQFVDKGNGYWHIQRAAGGTLPRLRTDNSEFADMQGTGWSGSYTYYELTDGFTDGTYFVTLPDGPTNYKRLQVNSLGEVKMVSTASNRTWESFTFTEVTEDTNPIDSNLFIEAEDYDSMSGIQNNNTNDTNGGEYVGWMDPNDWVEYSVNIPYSGNYTVDFRLASVPGSTGFEFQVNGNPLTSISVDSTGGWDTWYTATSNSIYLDAGNQTIRLYSVGNGWNINWFEIKPTNSSKGIDDSKTILKEIDEVIHIFPNPVNDILHVNLSENVSNSKIDIIDISGKICASKITSENNISINVNNLSPGLYFVRVYNNDALIALEKIIKQ